MNSGASRFTGGLSAGHGSEPVSAWVQRWSSLVPAGGTVLDVACGLGRHTRWFLARGHRVFAVDRSAAAIDGVLALAPSGIGERLETRVADLESGPWPFAGQRFDAVVASPTTCGALASGLAAGRVDRAALVQRGARRRVDL
jgi:SAM-dependent methyltransferase